MIIGYLDNNQRNISTDEQRDIVNQYARDNTLNIDIFLNDTDIKNIKNNINTKENTLIIANIACLGSKLAIILENIEFLSLNGFELISIKENLKFDSSSETLQLLKGIKLSIDIRNSFVSIITKKALSDKKADGYRLGFPKGKKCKNTILEQNKQKIAQLLREGKTKQQIADELNCSISSIFKYLQHHQGLKKSIRKFRLQEKI